MIESAPRGSTVGELVRPLARACSTGGLASPGGGGSPHHVRVRWMTIQLLRRHPRGLGAAARVHGVVGLRAAFGSPPSFVHGGATAWLRGCSGRSGSVAGSFSVAARPRFEEPRFLVDRSRPFRLAWSSSACLTCRSLPLAGAAQRICLTCRAFSHCKALPLHAVAKLQWYWNYHRRHAALACSRCLSVLCAPGNCSCSHCGSKAWPLGVALNLNQMAVLAMLAVP